MDRLKLLEYYKNCECGQDHSCSIRDIRIERDSVHKVGEILTQNGFPKKLYMVADATTAAAAQGIVGSLKGFDVVQNIYPSLRVATMDEVNAVAKEIAGDECGVLAVGTGSVHDTCRLACARTNKPLCLFATAASMDGFASSSAPIVDENFKISYSAKSPEVIIADTKILAAAPAELKRAGFGDMASKYVALIDWRVSNLISGESYCEKVAALTRHAVDSAMSIADKISGADEDVSANVMQGLLFSGMAMSFTGTSRPASGTEHIMAHYIECKELLDGKIPNYHGEDVGVTTLTILKAYDALLDVDSVTARREINDWAKIKTAYGALAHNMMGFNTPDTITDAVDPELIVKHFDDIKRIIASVPTYDEVRAKMIEAGCKLDYTDIGKTKQLYTEAFMYHPYMRRRLSLKRLLNMTDLGDRLASFAGL